MKIKIAVMLLLFAVLAACSTEDEGVLDTQIESLNKAKDLEQSIQDAAEAQRKLIEEQASQ